MKIIKCSRCKGHYPDGCVCPASHPPKIDPRIPPKPNLDDYDERGTWPEPKYLDKETKENDNDDY